MSSSPIINEALARVERKNPTLASKANSILTGNVIEAKLPKKKPAKKSKKSVPASQMKRKSAGAKPAAKKKSATTDIKKKPTSKKAAGDLMKGKKKKKKKLEVGGGSGLGASASKDKKSSKPEAKGKLDPKKLAKGESHDDKAGKDVLKKSAEGKPAYKIGPNTKKEKPVKVNTKHIKKEPLKPVEKKSERHKTPQYKKSVEAMDKAAKKLPKEAKAKGSRQRKAAAQVVRNIPNERIAVGVNRDPEKVEEAVAASVNGAAEGETPNRLTHRATGWLIGAGNIALLGAGAPTFLSLAYPGVATIAITHAINYCANAARSISASEDYINGLKEYIAQQIDDGDLIEQLLEEVEKQANGTAEGSDFDEPQEKEAEPEETKAS